MKGLLFSGGLDSACAWPVLGRPQAVYCGGSFGPARHANLGEMDAIHKMLEISPEFRQALHIIEYDFRPFMRDSGDYHFPRELICCALAWARGFDHLMVAFVKDDGMSAGWARAQEANFGRTIGMKNFRVSFPVAHMTKRELVEAALDNGASREFIEASYSCLAASKACGKCKSCRQRVEALTVLNRSRARPLRRRKQPA